MDIFKAAERLMSMDDNAWERHANPASVMTRYTCLPLIVLAIWSRSWIGWWCLLPLLLAIIWTWLNPRLFNPPTSTDSWAYRGVMGERLFLARKSRPVPDHHHTMAWRLTGLSMLGVLILAWGLLLLDFWAVMCGLAVTILPKVWFVDRMVWMHDEMQS